MVTWCLAGLDGRGRQLEDVGGSLRREGVYVRIQVGSRAKLTLGIAYALCRALGPMVFLGF